MLMSCLLQPTDMQNRRCTDAEQLRATIQQLDEHLRFGIRDMHVIKQASSHRGHMAATIIQVRGEVSMDV